MQHNVCYIQSITVVLCDSYGGFSRLAFVSKGFWTRQRKSAVMLQLCHRASVRQELPKPARSVLWRAADRARTWVRSWAQLLRPPRWENAAGTVLRNCDALLNASLPCPLVMNADNQDDQQLVRLTYF